VAFFQELMPPRHLLGEVGVRERGRRGKESEES
jgi:hypothetical protein